MTLPLFSERQAAAPVAAIEDSIFGYLDGDPDGLRWYQREAVDAVLEQLKQVRSTLVVAATGTGKTTMFGAIAKHWPGNVLILAHRDELVQQARRRVERMTGEWVEVEQAMMTSQSARIVCGSVQSLCKKKRLERVGAERFSLVVVDECFPAGTLVSGRPIETIKVGEMVESVDHASGSVSMRRVTRLFRKNCTSDMVRIDCGETHIVCTRNHPVFVRGKGYIDAGSVSESDVLCVWGSVPARVSSDVLEGVQVQAGRGEGFGNVPGAPAVAPEDANEVVQGVREIVSASSETAQSDVLERVSGGELVGDYGAHESSIRLEAHAGKQSDEQGGDSAEGKPYLAIDWAFPEGSRWQWTAADGGRSLPVFSAGMAHAGSRPDANGTTLWLPDLLQDRRGEPGAEDRNRGRRGEPRFADAPSAGCEEGRFLTWARVDRVSRVEQASDNGTVVYNLEVEGSHTYFANGILVHNCHHAPAASYRTILDFFADAKILGVTATPDRGDKQALGKVFESSAYTFDIEDGVDNGYLVPIRGHHVTLSDVNLDLIGKTAGDLAASQLDEAMLKATGGVVEKTMELYPGRQAIVFMPGVKSAELAVARFNKLKPGCAMFIHAGTDEDERAQMVRDFQRGFYQYFVNVGIATEGFDAPGVSLVVIARPTLSRALYAQMAGRGTRVLPDIIDNCEGRDLAVLRRELIAASKKPDCIAEGQRVLTDHGLVPIEDVTIAMKVWDGCSFVAHCGAILRGEREVISYAGLEATEDHVVYTKEGWKTFGECASEQIPVCVTGIGRENIQQSFGCFRRDDKEDPWGASALVGRMREMQAEDAQVSPQCYEWPGRMPGLRESAECPSLANQAMQRGASAMHEPEKQRLQTLRRPRHWLSFWFSAGNGAVDHSTHRAPIATVADRQDRQQRELRAGERSLVYSTTKPGSHIEETEVCAGPFFQDRISNDPLFGRHAVSHGGEDDVRRDRGAILPKVIKTKRRVWDILNAGPLHRFTVEGLLVHNCVILDFVGNSTKHSLVSTVDILGGKYTDEEVKRAKKKVEKEPGADPRAALERSREELRAIAASMRVKVKAESKEFNPFAVLHMDTEAGAKYTQKFGYKAMDGGLRNALLNYGLKEKQLEGMSRYDAMRFIAAQRARAKAGLCSYKMLVQLQRFGVTEVNVPFDRAKAAMRYIESKKWGRSGQVDPRKLDSIIHYRREPGDDGE